MNTFLIWWTNQADCAAIGDALPDVPVYLASEYGSRIGRNGRGRLWIHPALKGEAPNSVEFPVTPLANVLGDYYGGIVIRAADAACLRDLPGVITDLDVRRVDGQR